MAAIQAHRWKNHPSGVEHLYVAGRVKVTFAGRPELVAGRHLTVQIDVGHDQETDGFRQTLTFPLVVVGERLTVLPLAPSFLHFEDPEYNRRLASTPATATGFVGQDEGGKTVVHAVTLAVDRREYNPESRMALRYDWDGVPESGEAELEVTRIDTSGIKSPLDLPEILDSGRLKFGQLKQLSLLDFRQNGTPIRLQGGDTLQLALKPTQRATKKLPENLQPVVLSIKIVTKPVIPVPEAAYAVPRQQKILRRAEVECVRFAWGPEATRIELVCPDDLRTGLVRRRAVFRWTDTVRPATLEGYAVQKIAKNGSTHFPSRFLIDNSAEASARQS